MLICMRTTINLPDALAEAAKAKAAAEGRTFTSLVEEGLRAVLAAVSPTVPVELPAYGVAAGAVLVDVADREALWAALDADGRSEERRVGKECRRLCRSRWSPYH